MDGRDGLHFDTVLAPVDGSDESATALRYAVEIADRYDGAVHSLYVLGRGVRSGIDAGTVDAETVATSTHEFFADGRAMAVDADVPFSTSTDVGFSTRRKQTHPGTVVLDTADEIGADFIVLPRETASERDAKVLERAAEYVLSYASQPVLSV